MAKNNYPAHHLSDELLLDYASGALDEATGILVASHTTLCPQCRNRLRSLEAIGGMLLENVDVEPMESSMLDAVMARLDDAEEARPAKSQASVAGVLPAPLRAYIGGDLEEIDWSYKGSGVSMAEISTVEDGPRAFMLKVDPERAVPQHSHDGNEFVMVLTGGYTDDSGHFVRGDVEIADASVEHQPVADAGEPCVILAVTDGPLRFTGPLGGILNMFVRL